MPSIPNTLINVLVVFIGSNINILSFSLSFLHFCYSFGRHTKSVDTEKKRCGYCYGKFEIFINKTSKSGETKSVPVTPKKAVTGFALFVKENYAMYKTPQLNHAQVMKLLGEKFNELRLSTLKH